MKKLPKIIDGPLLMQDEDPSDEQLGALMHEVGQLAAERKKAAEKKLMDTLNAQTKIALNNLKDEFQKNHSLELTEDDVSDAVKWARNKL
jgi:hypothetical protein